MQRILVESQSNPLFRGIQGEHDYEQRGLCQIGRGHVLATTHPVSRPYLDYWQGLGFSLPHRIVAGPFDPRFNLSQLLLRKPRLREAIRSLTVGRRPRLEFFHIEPSEARLAKALDLPAYCSFRLAWSLSDKIAFKKLCARLSLPTPPCAHARDLLERTGSDKEWLWREPVLLKHRKGTGGVRCGGMMVLQGERDRETLSEVMKSSPSEFFVERLVPSPFAEVSLHWEITEASELKIHGFFDQKSSDYSYVGASFPSTLSPSLRSVILRQLRGKLIPYLRERDAKGFFCCDILVDSQGVPQWIDFHPRKGAILYIRSMVRRMESRWLRRGRLSFNHLQASLPFGSFPLDFQGVEYILKDLLQPDRDPFLVVTNPGIVESGRVDLTAVSRASFQATEEILGEAQNRLQCCVKRDFARGANR